MDLKPYQILIDDEDNIKIAGYGIYSSYLEDE